MTDLPQSLRRALAANFVIQSVRPIELFQSSDATRRYLLDTEGEERIETVWIPEDERDTICISTQAGCPLACTFCMTGVIGLRKNLSPGEIVAQVGIVLNHVYGPGEAYERGLNVVLMGMGEPLANYENVIRAIRILADPRGMNISQRRITLSTAGVVSRIYDLGNDPVRPELAISLSAPRDALRDHLMPINRRWPIAELLNACRNYPLRPRERITFEYVMLDGVNDSDREAFELAQLLQGLASKVNLIPHNPSPELPYRPSPDARILTFQRILRSRKILAFIRTPRGRDISAACGQLAARTHSP
jgi:23S rRNA (adenine2503-C2)-methyltransferase